MRVHGKVFSQFPQMQTEYCVPLSLSLGRIKQHHHVKSPKGTQCVEVTVFSPQAPCCYWVMFLSNPDPSCMGANRQFLLTPQPQPPPSPDLHRWQILLGFCINSSGLQPGHRLGPQQDTILPHPQDLSSAAHASAEDGVCIYKISVQGQQSKPRTG